MKKNLIFLTLLISVLMVSVVSAGITGYLTANRGGIADGGYTARLQKVEGTTAIVSVQTPEGDTKIVRVAEGETANVGDVQISASDLTRGTLFRRSGANVEIDVVPAGVEGAKGCEKITLKEGELFGEEYSWEAIINSDSGEVTGILIHFGGDIGDVKIFFGEATVVGETSITLLESGNFAVGENWVILSVCPKKPTESKKHTHLSDYRFLAKPMDIFNIQILNAKVNETNGTIDCKSIGKDYVVLGGGYRLNPNEAVAGYVLVTNGPINERFYQVALRDWNDKIKSGTIYATCARIEPTLHQFSQDY